MTDTRELKQAVEEADALDLPDGAYWEWIAERVGLPPGSGWEVAQAVASDPKAFGYTDPADD